MMDKVFSQHSERVRQLCALGLPPHLVVPKFISLLREAMPFQVGSFIWVNDASELDHVYSEYAKIFDLVPNYLAYSKSENLGMNEVFHGLPYALRHQSATHTDNLWKVDRDTFRKHQFYNEIFAPLGIHEGIFRPIRVRGKVEGALMINRGLEFPLFSNRDIQNIDKIARHLDYSLSVPQESDFEFSKIPSGTEYITTDTTGRLLNYTVGAEQLLHLCETGDLKRTSSGGRMVKTNASPLIQTLARKLLELAEGKDVSPPTFTFDHKWGRFRITAYFMHPVAAGSSNPLITARIEHFLPPQLLLMEKLEQKNLTSRQREICLQIGLDASYEQIATNLGIAKSTVVSHKKEIFWKLNISNRSELVDRVVYG